MAETAQERFEQAHIAWEMFPDHVKMAAMSAYLEGYKLGYGVEELTSLDYRAIESHFDNWWKVNAPESD